ncbi:MAG: O-methyltransferase family 3 [Acidimicrobiia bacterium]|nr:O-methyltransferase family 3 [Acidimicrobiia bacterium]
MARSEFIKSDIAEYAAAHSAPPDDVQLSLQTVTQEKFGRRAGMQIGHDQALLMEMLTRAMGVRTAVEVGTFTGYSALAVARGLAPGGTLYCFDISDEWTAVGREHWRRAGVDDRIVLKLGNALDSLAELDSSLQFDLAFIDADKDNYIHYFEALLPRMRVGALLLIDNTLWSGKVLDDSIDDADTVALRQLNDMLAADPRVQVVQLPLGDGVSVVQKR